MFLPSALRPTNLLGPYETWMFGPGKTYDLPGLLLDDEASFSAVAEFPEGRPVADLQQSFEVRRGNGAFVRVRVPTLYAEGDFRPRFIPFLMTPVDKSRALRGQGAGDARAILNPFLDGRADARGAADHFRLNFPVRAETIDMAFPGAGPAADVPDPRIKAGDALVILAIIDHGVPFAHGALRGPGGGTRVDFCWSQTAPADGSGAVPFGREFGRAGIDRMIADHEGDEDAIYRAAGVTSHPGQPPMPLDRMHSHGAHVLGTMAGHWDAGTAAQARIIAVDLPASSVWETSGFGKDMFVLAGLHYIFDRARRIAKSLGRAEGPLVVNLSYGYSGGPHDDTGLIDGAMDELVAERRKVAPTALVMPSGNMFQDRLHARIDDGHFTQRLDGSRAADLHWFAPPDDRTSSFCELWLPPEADEAEVSLEVIPPGSVEAANAPLMDEPEPAMRVTDLVVGGKIAKGRIKGGQIVGQYSVDLFRGKRWRITVALAPTDPVALPPTTAAGTAHSSAPAGRWTLRVVLPKGTALKGAIAARIQRDTSYGQGNTGARQGFFVDPADVPYGPCGAPAETDSTDAGAVLRRFGTINGMATSPRTLVVAGHVVTTRAAARYSSAGSALAPAGRQVDCSAPVERSPVLPGVVGAGTRTGITVALRGTSSAAPQAARALAAALLAGHIPDDESYLSLLPKPKPAPATAAAAASATDADPRLGWLLLAPLDDG